MSKFTSILLYLLIILHLKNSLANDADVTLSTQSSESQCGGYCFFALKPILDHIAANQERWNACDATKLECPAKLDRMELQEKLEKMVKLKKLVNFVQIRSRFFYIEKERKVNWFSATNICRQMGGHLASPISKEEFYGFKKHLEDEYYYWVGISDLANHGQFMSQATGSVPYFLRWAPNEPNPYDKDTHCVELRSDLDYLMDNTRCESENLFICEVADES